MTPEDLAELSDLLFKADPRLEAQRERQEASLEAGARRYRKSVQHALDSGEFGRTSVGRTIIDSSTADLSILIARWIAESTIGPASRRSCAVRIKSADPIVLAYIVLRIALSQVFVLPGGSFVSFNNVAREIGMAVEATLLSDLVQKVSPQDLKRLMTAVEERYGSAHKAKMLLKGSRAIISKSTRADSREPWTLAERAQIGTALLTLLVDLGSVVEAPICYSHKVGHGIRCLAPSEALAEWAMKRHDYLQYLRPIHHPMLLPPLPWSGNSGGGYLRTGDRAFELPMVRTRIKEQRKALATADLTTVNAALNALQEVPWQFNREVFEVFDILWSSQSRLANLPSQETTTEQTFHLPETATEEEVKAHKKKLRRMHKEWSSAVSRVISHRILIDSIREILDGQFHDLFFPYQTDFRGRVYAVPTSITPQGSDLQKALLRFRDGAPLGADGSYWLAIHGANTAGVDKVSFDDRVKWVRENEAMILSCAADPLGDTRWADMDSPWQFLAFCFEWAGFIREGETFVSRIAVAFDGSCSGLQHLSAMTRDEVGGAGVNLIPGEIPSDVYSRVAEVVLRRVQHDAEHGDVCHPEHPEKPGSRILANDWLHFGIDRKTVKRPVMTLSYGATRHGFSDQVWSDVIQPALDDRDPRVPPQWVDDNARIGSAAQYIASLIWEASTEVLVRGAEAMRWLQSVSDGAFREGGLGVVQWTAPSGFPAHQGYLKDDVRKTKVRVFGETISVSVPLEGCPPDPRKNKSSISPNFVHSMDAAHLVLTVNRAVGEGVNQLAMIHDSFGCPAGQAGTLYRTVREAFVQMYTEHDVLESFRAEVQAQIGESAEIEPPPPRGHLDIEGVLDSRYCFA